MFCYHHTSPDQVNAVLPYGVSLGAAPSHHISSHLSLCGGMTVIVTTIARSLVWRGQEVVHRAQNEHGASCRVLLVCMLPLCPMIKALAGVPFDLIKECKDFNTDRCSTQSAMCVYAPPAQGTPLSTRIPDSVELKPRGRQVTP